MTKSPKPLGLYLHIPFCHARCGYCDFVTFTGKEDRIDLYVEDLCKEIAILAASPHPSPIGRGREILAGEAITTVFFGGGTPSLLEPRHVSKILDHVRTQFILGEDAEITLESNPESVTREKSVGWAKAGINRVSLGLQAFDNRLLKAMDRLHTVEEFQTAYQEFRLAGFANINVDLIYGFPEQSLADWQDTLRRTVRLNPEHLSLYSLKVEEHTPFRAQGVQVNEDMQADMYEWARDFLRQSGYPQYEISNFSRPGLECRHNLLYWRQDNYLAAGTGAVGCVDGLRWENHKNMKDYHQDLAAGKLPQASVEKLTEDTSRFERLMLGLRLREGLVWPEGPKSDWLNKRSELVSRHLLEQTAVGRWRIPDAAVSFTNQVILPFL